jgi:hypothetical protein
MVWMINERLRGPSPSARLGMTALNAYRNGVAHPDRDRKIGPLRLRDRARDWHGDLILRAMGEKSVNPK